MTFLRRKVGVLGGGQLARMLALKGHELGLEVHVISPRRDEPAAQVTAFHHHAQPDSPLDLDKLNLKDFAALTFESEFLSAESLAAWTRSSGQTRLRPSPELMGRIQDRASQKQLLLEHQVPTLPFRTLSDPLEAKELLKEWPMGLVLKQRRFGYDGYGTFFVRKASDIPTFQKESLALAHGLIAEPLLRFDRELALLVARSADGTTATFPVVQTQQNQGRCVWVKGPIHHPAANRLVRRLKTMMKKVDYVGVLACELFASRGKLLVNELAPRVHNSGHYSLDALDLDQFTAHWLATLGERLHDPMPHARGFAMVNLLGEVSSPPRPGTPRLGHLHWYAKPETRPGRKMGHLNVVAKTPDLALKIALKEARRIWV